MTEHDGRDQPGPPDETGETRPVERARGRMTEQDASTTPREPTLAEKRAREQGARRRAEEARLAEEEAGRRKKRKRILIGSGVAVGVVALIAVGYAVSSDDEEVQARCVDDNNVVVDDGNCVTPASASNNTYYGGGGFFPIFIGAGGRQYHYNYGGSGNIGQVATGGTTTVPQNATVRTPSGKTISRGGLGVSNGGSSSGGSKGTSGGSSSSGGKSGGSSGS
ncbi:hypothetical protein LWC33_02590 [Pseudonocardia sp. RS11V-5]|uniref:hypothetical protein n=1 Tax=Pseudonocardia terrae TaxID=2905831 RepID=UPI001E4FC338|nr:hypothetical protein [Pseudonocardia terrae]MCE3550346.1 hypothetical protein [Pseudonocardia terrae]